MKSNLKIAGWVAVGAIVGSLITIRLMPKVQLPTGEPNYGLKDDILVQGNTGLNEIAITIDDGPRPESTSKILDILKEHHVRATFFVVGKMVAKYPELVRRMMAEGHEVGNHTYTHRRLTTLTEEQVRTEIGSCHRAIKLATGTGASLFRPPGMRYNESILKIAQDLGYVTIHWNSAVEDYTGNQNIQTAAAITRRIADSERGSVILIHGHPSTVEALPRALEELLAKGTRFVTVSQMLARLPRPVYVKSNAYQTVEPPKPIARVTQTPRAKPKRGAGRQPMVAMKQATATRLAPKSAIDIAAEH